MFLLNSGFTTFLRRQPRRWSVSFARIQIHTMVSSYSLTWSGIGSKWKISTWSLSVIGGALRAWETSTNHIYHCWGIYETSARLVFCWHTCRYKMFFIVGFSSHWNSLPGACFPLPYNLDCYKRNFQFLNLAPSCNIFILIF